VREVRLAYSGGRSREPSPRLGGRAHPCTGVSYSIGCLVVPARGWSEIRRRDRARQGARDSVHRRHGAPAVRPGRRDAVGRGGFRPRNLATVFRPHLVRASAVAAGTILVLLLAGFAAGEDLILCDFESTGASEVTISQAVEGSVKYTLDSDAAHGRYLAMEFDRLPESTTAYVKLPIAKKMAADAARYDGLTMKVSGDGSTTYGVIEMTTGNNGRFVGVFPLTSTEWRSVSIRWDDFVAIGDKSQAFMDASLAESFSFGSREQWGSAKYAVDDISLAAIPPQPPVVARQGTDHFMHLAAKLARGEPVTIAAIGDSITVGVKVAEADRADKLYFHYVARGLEAAFPPAKATAVNAGIGGESFGRGLVRVGHQVDAAQPDLVIILFGANDAGSDHMVERVRHELSAMIDHLIAETSADILVLSPTVGAYKIELLDRYAEMYKEVAAEKGVAFFDLRAAQKALPQQEQDRLLYTDKTHMVEYGHRRSGEMILSYVLSVIRPAPSGIESTAAKRRGRRGFPAS